MFNKSLVITICVGTQVCAVRGECKEVRGVRESQAPPRGEAPLSSASRVCLTKERITNWAERTHWTEAPKGNL